MDYGRILQDAWALTWRYRFLWLFGLFAGGTGAGGLNFNLPSGGGPGPDAFGGGPDGSETMEQFRQSIAAAMAEVQGWVAANLGLLVVLGVMLLILAIFLMLVSLVCKGSLLGALGLLGQGQASSFGSALSLGFRYLPSLLGLWLLVAVGVFLLALVIGAALTPVGTLSGETPPVALLAALGLFGLLVFLISIPLTAVLAFAERAIVVDGFSVFGALGRGFGLLRDRIGPSLLLWLISVAIGIGAGIAIAIAAVFLLIPIAIVVAIPFLVVQVHLVSILIAAMGALTFVVALWLAGAVLNTYVAAFWTLAYLALTNRYPSTAPA